MSENEEKKTVDKKEPIDSIEETVEELRKKIAELDEEDKKTNEEKNSDGQKHSILSEEQKQKVNDIKESAVKTVNSSIDQIKEKAADLKENGNLDKTVAYIKEHAVKAVDNAKVKIDEIKQNPKVADASSKAGETLKAAGVKAGEALKDAGGRAQDFYNEHVPEKTRQDISDGLNKAASAVKEGTKKAVRDVDEFVNRPDVQEKIGNAKKSTKDLFDKGTDFVNGLFNKKEKDNKTGE